ncbi:hypothetical protein B0H67DRAFT_582158 [Lasiosphaeris hirsuta]|uniref:EGF domain-specific O-linked N-acetylglucosamine transferase n=1 Tax=Lasiosphaeris hirsuta TaxID=260670 RepID=A0AA40AHL1_9PEZI|nr:hypothetical protein B0H67DRAFT_582158 [Lasiosphaeris hirsuta]
MLTVSPRNGVVALALIFCLIVAFQFPSFNDTRWNELRDHASAMIGRPPAPADEGLSLPSDYLWKSDDQEQCEQFYGLSYIRNIAQNQHSYCQDGSPSTMQCFLGNRLQGPWDTDPLCLARGALVSRGKPTSLHCQLRNFTMESEHSPEAAVKNTGVHGIDDMGSYFFDTGAGEEFRTWTFGEGSGDGGAACSAQASTNNGQWILLAKREGNVNLWHKLMEIWQAIISIEALRLARNPATGQPYLTAAELAGIRVVLEDDRAEPLDDWWTMVAGKAPVRKADLPDGCYANVIIPLAGSSSPFWTFLLERREHEVCRTPALIDAFVRRILSHLGLIPRAETAVRADPVVTIIDRKQTRKFRDLDVLAARLRERHPRARFHVVDLAALSLREQVALVQDSDVLVGHHGAGMTHVLFLPAEAAAVEIFPPVFPSLGFRHVARMRGVTHFVGHCMWHEEWDWVVNGVALPEGWTPPANEAGWQEAEWTYMAEDEFVGLVDAAVRSQLNRRPVH